MANASAGSSPTRVVLNILFDRVVPAALFGTLTFARLRGLGQLLLSPSDPAPQAQLMHFVMLTYGALGLVFMAFITALYFIRRTPVSARAPLRAKLIAVAGTFVMWLALVQPPMTSSWELVAFADVAMIVGLVFSLYALGTLRACFGIAPEARGLVTTGAYRMVRHPVYLGEFVIFLGAVLPMLSPFTVLIFLVFCGLQTRRAILEEAVLSATFPDYVAYRSRTPAVLPLTNRLRRGPDPETDQLETARRDGIALATNTIRHGLGNKLAVVVGYTELLADDAHMPPEGHELAIKVLASANAAADILHQLERQLAHAEIDSTLAGTPVLKLESN